MIVKMCKVKQKCTVIKPLGKKKDQRKHVLTCEKRFILNLFSFNLCEGINDKLSMGEVNQSHTGIDALSDSLNLLLFRTMDLIGLLVFNL